MDSQAFIINDDSAETPPVLKTHSDSDYEQEWSDSEDEWSESEEEDDDDEDDDNFLERFRENLERIERKNEQSTRAFEESNRAFEEFEKRHDFMERMQENLDWRKTILRGAYCGKKSYLQVEREVQLLDEETIEIYGGCFEKFSDCKLPEGVVDHWPQVYHCQELEEWWSKEYLPAYQSMRKSYQVWKRIECKLSTWGVVL